MFSSEKMFTERSVKKLKNAIRYLQLIRIVLKSMQSIFLNLPFLPSTTPIQKIFLRRYLISKIPFTASNIFLTKISINSNNNRIFPFLPKAINKIPNFKSKKYNNRWSRYILNIINFDHITFSIKCFTLYSLLWTI